jgi:DNA-binding winged helix-turn-helix (wHTH) protein
MKAHVVFEGLFPTRAKLRVLRFGDLTLDESRLELRRGAERILVQPKALRVLLHLGMNYGRTVGSEELLSAVWPDETVSPGSIKRAIRAARRALGDDGEAQQSIRTIRGSGYRLIVPVTITEQGWRGANDVTPAGNP